MPIVWRLTAVEYATKLDGKGNIERGARWNSPGRGVVYASLNLSLAVLEAFVQLPAALRRALPELAATQVELPGDASQGEVKRSELPSDLTGEAAAGRCRELGDAWIDARKHLFLLVPSVIVPQEQNLLINPLHPEMARVQVRSVELFRFDPRLANARD
jgi:RES domain-containing protein